MAKLGDELRDEAMKVDHPVPIVKRMLYGRIVYGTIDSHGVIKGKLYRAGQNPEDGPICDYSNVPFSQYE